MALGWNNIEQQMAIEKVTPGRPSLGIVVSFSADLCFALTHGIFSCNHYCFLS